MRARKSAISLRIDNEVLQWFRTHRPAGYQTLMNSVLAQYVAAETQRSHWRAGRAQEAFNKFHALCFWHYEKDLRITPDNMPLVIEGLKKYGGRAGLLLAEELCQ